MSDWHAQVVEAIRQVQRQIRWKPGSAEWHLRKHQSRGHLPTGATLRDYEQTIHSVVVDRAAAVYLYVHKGTPYVAIVSTVQAQSWLVMFGLDGVLESAYVVKRPHLYLKSRSLNGLAFWRLCCHD